MECANLVTRRSSALFLIRLLLLVALWRRVLLDMVSFRSCLLRDHFFWGAIAPLFNEGEAHIEPPKIAHLRLWHRGFQLVVYAKFGKELSRGWIDCISTQ